MCRDDDAGLSAAIQPPATAAERVPADQSGATNAKREVSAHRASPTLRIDLGHQIEQPVGIEIGHGARGLIGS
jgi:hypothetical protein